MLRLDPCRILIHVTSCSSLHYIYNPCCILIHTASWYMLRLDTCCILIHAASWSLLHLDSCSILILVASWSMLHGLVRPWAIFEGYEQYAHDIEQISRGVHDISTIFFKILKMRVNLTYRVSWQKAHNHHIRYDTLFCYTSVHNMHCIFVQVSFLAPPKIPSASW